MEKSINKIGAVIIEGHVQGLSNTRSLGEKGIPVYVVDKNDCIARQSKYCLKFFKSPDFLKDSFADFLINLAKNENIKNWVLYPSNDHAVYTISRYKGKLEEYYKIITPGIDIINKIYDKINLINLAKNLGIPVPETHVFQTLYEPFKYDLTFPVITKGRNGLSFYKKTGKKALLAHSGNELKNQLKEINQSYGLNNSFTQELIPDIGHNKTISFTAFCVDGAIKTHWTGMKIREHPVRFGTATFAKSTYLDECYEQSTSLLKALKYTGVCEIEFLKDPRTKEFKLIEMNPRTWLWVELAKASGVDYAKIIYDYILGYTPMFPSRYNENQYWINPFTDFVYSFKEILMGRYKLSLYLKTMSIKNKVNAVYKKGDIKPLLAYILNIPSFLFNR